MDWARVLPLPMRTLGQPPLRRKGFFSAPDRIGSPSAFRALPHALVKSSDVPIPHEKTKPRHRNIMISFFSLVGDSSRSPGVHQSPRGTEHRSGRIDGRTGLGPEPPRLLEIAKGAADLQTPQKAFLAPGRHSSPIIATCQTTRDGRYVRHHCPSCSLGLSQCVSASSDAGLCAHAARTLLAEGAEHMAHPLPKAVSPVAQS